MSKIGGANVFVRSKTLGYMMYYAGAPKFEFSEFICFWNFKNQILGPLRQLNIQLNL